MERIRKGSIVKICESYYKCIKIENLPTYTFENYLNSEKQHRFKTTEIENYKEINKTDIIEQLKKNLKEITKCGK